MAATVVYSLIVVFTMMLPSDTSKGSPCIEDPLQTVREELMTLMGDILERAKDALEPNVDGAGDRFVMLMVSDIADALLRLTEAFYLQMCHLSGCSHCGSEAPHPSTGDAAAFEETNMGRRFNLLADRVDLFAGVVNSAADLAETEDDRRRESSPLPGKRNIIRAIKKDMDRLRNEGLAQKLDRHFAKSFESPDPTDGPKKFMEISMLGRNLIAIVHGHVAEALGLVPKLGLEGRHLPGLHSGWGHEPYFKYLQHNGTSAAEFFAMLRGDRRFTWPFTRSSALCDRSEWLFALARPSPPELPQQDSTGAFSWHAASAHELLERIGRRGHSLSYTYWAVRTATQFGKEMACETSKGILFDPTRCLDEKDWGGSIYFVNPDPKPKEKERLYVQWRAHAWHGERSVENPLWKAFLYPITPPAEPMDIISLSPLAGNCELLRHALTADSMTIARLVYVPINPVIPPPLEAEPNYTEFWVNHRQWSRVKHKAGEMDGKRLAESAVRYILAQCSLERVCRILRPIGYELLHVEHIFAVFVHHSVAKVFREHRSDFTTSSGLGAGLPTPFHAWRQGWYCSPLSRYMNDLEVRAPFNSAWLDPTVSNLDSVCKFFSEHEYLASTEEAHISHGCNLRAQSTDVATEAAIAVRRRQRALWATEPPSSMLGILQKLGMHGNANRATCNIGPPAACACLVPYRGATCDMEDRGDVENSRPYRAAIGFVVAGPEAEETILSELSHALVSLWDRFNALRDYPVLVFYRRLSDMAREKLVLATSNRVWFFDISASLKATAEQHFMSGPLLEHPAVSKLDFFWRLDAWSYFPEDVAEDPFQVMHKDPTLMIAYRNVARVQTPTAQHKALWDHTLLYLTARGLNDWAGLSKGKTNHLFTSVIAAGRQDRPQWNRKVINSGCEILRVSLFQHNSTYMNFVSFLHSHGGRAALEQEVAAVRTLGVAVSSALTSEASAATRTIELHSLPYARKDFCRCGMVASAATPRECKQRSPRTATGGGHKSRQHSGRWMCT